MTTLAVAIVWVACGILAYGFTKGYISCLIKRRVELHNELREKTEEFHNENMSDQEESLDHFLNQIETSRNNNLYTKEDDLFFLGLSLLAGPSGLIYSLVYPWFEKLPKFQFCLRMPKELCRKEVEHQ